MPQLLLELLSEEIPARMQVRAADDLKRLVMQGLKAAGLDHTETRTHVTPRRLTLMINGIPAKQPDVSEERRGPRANAPAQARDGFRKSLPPDTEVEERETEKGTFLFAKIEQPGAKTRVVLPDLISAALNGLSWPKSMRWGTGKSRWVRPLHSILAVYDQEGLDLAFAGIEAGIKTRGHAFMAPGVIEVADFADYETSLRAARVVLDRDERKQIIAEEAASLVARDGLALRDDPGLLDEVAGLVEWPVVLMGAIDGQFMEVPAEVLITSMRSHQKYFSVLDGNGNLAPWFIVVANRDTDDGGRRVIAGNERVLRARLADAKFFWDQDRLTSLASKAPKLKDRVFHAKLGTVDEKVDRMQALAVELSAFVPGADRDQVRSAARLAKADLSTGMVGEFPDLQGVMGSYYARHDGESAAVAQAIAEHYAPQGPDDACPTAPVSVVVALADKIDTLAGFWSIDEKPTGSKDPFALRRAALGVIRLITENGLRMKLSDAIQVSARSFDIDDFDQFDLLDFFKDRLKVYLRGEGVKHDHFDAVFETEKWDDLVQSLSRLRAVSEFVDTPDGQNMMVSYGRAVNILRAEEKRDGRVFDARVDSTLLKEAEESELHQALSDAKPKFEAFLEEEKYTEAMAELAGLRQSVDAFFDKVTVNDEDSKLRENRLRLLSMIRGASRGVADFSKIEG